MPRLFLSRWVLIFVALTSATRPMQASAQDATQPTRNRRVDFGANGHPLNPGTYSTLSLEQQLSLLKELGLTTYRVNVNPAHPEKFDRLSELVTLAQREEIRILPVVILPPAQFFDENAAYNAAKSAMHNMARQFGVRISVWELGNEYDLYCVKNNADGASPSDYDTGKYNIVRGLIRGMLAGLHEGSPSSRSIVQTSQHTSTSLDSGFLQRLIQDGITFDITGYHYYSNNGRIPTTKDGTKTLAILRSQFHKPIWITEFDKSSISPTLGPSSDPKQQAIALTAALNEIATAADQYDILGADIYELLDQPELLQDPAVKPCQAQFGILNSHGGLTDASMAVEEFLRDY